jgi:cytochrome c biogenesis protein
LGNKEKVNIFDRIWDFFASVKLAIVLICLLAVTSIIGTVVPQESTKAIQFLGRIFGDNTAPAVYNIFLKLDFMDMYHSWWFVTLLVLFCVNLTVCSIEKIPRTWRLVRTPVRPLAKDVLEKLLVKKEASFKASPEIARDEFLNAFRASKYNVKEAVEENSVQLYSEKWAYSRLGVYVVHLSILLIFVGAIIGARFGFDGSINLPEGYTSDVVYSLGGEPTPLGFSIRCNWYNTDYYTGSDTPREFSSELSILEDGKEVMKKVIEVNDPLTYKGFTFYQSSYGPVPNAVGIFVLKVSNDRGLEETLRLNHGESFEIPGSKVKGTIMGFSPALGRDPRSGDLTTYSESLVNPAVSIRFDMEGSDGFTGWVLKRYPETGIIKDAGLKIEFLDYWGAEYTGLQVSKDPGVIIIYIASIVMVLGLYAAFFLSHKKLWIRIAPVGKGSVKVTIGGSASKNRLALEKQAEHILSRASAAIDGRLKKN